MDQRGNDDTWNSHIVDRDGYELGVVQLSHGNFPVNQDDYFILLGANMHILMTQVLKEYVFSQSVSLVVHYMIFNSKD